MKFLLSILFLAHVIALDKTWWKHSNMYEIYTPSFKDSNGDGWGDLQGITSKLDYLKDLGVDTIYLTPYHPSPLHDTGYDVSDYLAVHPSFGTMADFDELMHQLKQRNMKFILDLVINHSSDQHEWFEKSIERIYPYTDYYIWRDPKGYKNASDPILPNNWCTWFNTPAWTWNEKRKQFYFHVFLREQPDLNLRNPRVIKEVEKIIKFWLDKGVAGVRLDAVASYTEDPLFEDEEPYYEGIDTSKNVECSQLKRTKTMNQKDTFGIVRHIRAYIDKLSSKADTLERIVILEFYGGKKELKAYLGNESDPGGHFAFNCVFLFHFDYLNSTGIDKAIDYSLEEIPKKSVPNWQLDNHDLFRKQLFFIQEYVNVLLTLISTLPGIMVLYYGEEIGMTAGVIHPYQRTHWGAYSRTPMQWDKSRNGGFSSNVTTWLPVNPNYWRLNVKEEQSNEKSVYNFVRNLLTLRKTNVMLHGSFEKFILSDWIVVIKRTFKKQSYFVVLNLATEEKKINLDPYLSNSSVELKVYSKTPNSKLRKGAIVVKKKKRSFIINPMSAVILSQENRSSMIISD